MKDILKGTNIELTITPNQNYKVKKINVYKDDDKNNTNPSVLFLKKYCTCLLLNIIITTFEDVINIIV